MPDIRHEVLIVSTAERIYSALTDQKELSAWWTPDTIAKQEENSISRFRFGPDYFKEMKILQLKPFELVEWFCIEGADEWIGTTISFKLHDAHKQRLLIAHPEAKDQIEPNMDGIKATILRFHHDKWKDYTPMFAECNYTWGRFLRSLKLYCETGKGIPWPNQHRIQEQ